MKWIHPMVWRGLVLTGLFVLGAIFLFSYNQVQKPVLAGTEGRTFERAVVVDILQDNVQENGSRIGDQTVSLQLMEGSRTGEIVEANCPNGMLFGTVCRKGMEVELELLIDDETLSSILAESAEEVASLIAALKD